MVEPNAPAHDDLADEVVEDVGGVRRQPPRIGLVDLRLDRLFSSGVTSASALS